jgi:hypothetical protein
MSFCLATFISKHDRFKAEDLFRNHGLLFALIPPPAWMRTNCDYAVRFDAELKEKVAGLFTQLEIRVEQWITEPELSLSLSDRLKQHLMPNKMG